MRFLDRVQLKPPPSEPPVAIDMGDQGELVILWPHAEPVAVEPHRLRDACPCAQCVEEGTGRKLLDPDTIPADIHPLQIAPVGNYAIQIEWSDGHSTGIYSWETLRRASGR